VYVCCRVAKSLHALHIESIAVIPFDPVGGNADTDLISDRLTESLI